MTTDARRVGTETYVSTDVETDGPIPGPNSMLSIASAAFTTDGVLIGTYTANLKALDGATPDVDTTKFWSEFPEAYAASRVDPRDPGEVMPEYIEWVESLPGTPVFVAYPAAFDFTWVFWYLMRFAGKSPFGYSALDMKTFAMVLLHSQFENAQKPAWPSRWTPPEAVHTHIALDDALEQGMQFCSMLRDSDAVTRSS